MVFTVYHFSLFGPCPKPHIVKRQKSKGKSWPDTKLLQGCKLYSFQYSFFYRLPIAIWELKQERFKPRVVKYLFHVSIISHVPMLIFLSYFAIKELYLI